MARKSLNLNRFLLAGVLISLLASFTLAVFSVPEKAVHAETGDVTIILGAYTTPREVYAEIIPLFQKFWLDKTGKKVVFQESYQGSGAQSRAIAGGFEADIAALSLEADITRLVDAKLITHDWKANDYKGIVSSSVVTLAVREGNPKQIKDWADLTQAGLEILTPDPATSGGAQWNLLAAIGAAQRGKVKGYDATEDGALKYLGDLIKNVTVFDKDGRSSILNFEKGVGDVAITYENEILGGRAAGATYVPVYPTSTILIETPVAVVDAYVDKHGTREVAEAFLKFLWTPEAQAVFTKHGYRAPVNHAAAGAAATQTATEAATGSVTFPAIADQFTIDYFGGWAKAGPAFFGKDGKALKVISQVKGK